MTIIMIVAILVWDIHVRDRPEYLRPLREPLVRPGERVVWLARLSGRGDYLFPVPGVVVRATWRNVTIAVQAFGGETVRRVVRPDRLLPQPE